MDRRAWAIDAGIALAATGVELALLLDDGSASVAAVLATLAAGAALALRRVAALAVLAATLAAAVTIVAIGEAPSGLSVLVALGTTAATRKRRVSLGALVPTIVVVTALSVVTADDGRASSVVVGALAAGPLAAGIWGLGAYARTRRRYREELEARAPTRRSPASRPAASGASPSCGGSWRCCAIPTPAPTRARNRRWPTSPASSTSTAPRAFPSGSTCSALPPRCRTASSCRRTGSCRRR